ncbi:MAG TPA: TolC family protein [Chondromyces sp.]|nr:TolC family protein [Chondromyces sp.]
MRRAATVACVAAVTVAAAGGWLPAGAQDRTEVPDVPAPPPLAGVTEPDVGARPGMRPAADGAVRLTLAAALSTALTSSPTLEVEQYLPLVARTAIPEAWAVFDPQLAAGAAYRDATNQLSAVQSFTFRPDDDGGDGQDPAAAPRRLERQSFDLSATASTLFPTGTRLALSGLLTSSETNFTPREYEGSWSLELRQSLLEGFGREVNLVAVRQSANRAVGSEWQLRRAVLEVVAAVETAYWELVLAQEVVDIREFGVRLASEQLALNRDLVDTGRAVDSAVLSASAEQASRRADLAEAEGDVRALSATLTRLLGAGSAAPGERYAAVDEPDVERVAVDAERSVQLALELRPELYRDRAALANRDLEVIAARDLLEPRLDLSAGYGRSSLGPSLADAGEHLIDDSPFDTWWLGVVLDLPLSRRGDRARLERATLTRLQAAAVLDDTASRVTEEVRRAAIDVETQWLRVEATREAVEGRREELRIERDRYQVGMSRNLDVLLVQRLLIQAEVDAAAARVDFLQALTELYRAEGTLLERRRIVVAGTR